LINPCFWDIMLRHWASGSQHFETMAFQNPMCCIPSDAVLCRIHFRTNIFLTWTYSFSVLNV
jgi:hypothetical protein